MPIHGKQHPDYQRKPIKYDRDFPYSEKIKNKNALCTAVLLSVLLHHTYNDEMVS